MASLPEIESGDTSNRNLRRKTRFKSTRPETCKNIGSFDIPDLKIGVAVNTPTIHRRKQWSSIEDRRLILAHMIGKSFSENKSFNFLTRVIPGMSRSTLMSRVKTIKDKKDKHMYVRLIDSATSVWQALIQENLDNDTFSFDSSNIHDKINGWVDIIERKLNECNIAGSLNPSLDEDLNVECPNIELFQFRPPTLNLDYDLENIRERYNLTVEIIEKNLSKRLENVENQKPYLDILTSASLCWNSSSEIGIKEIINVDSIQRCKLKIIIKINLLIPEAEYKASRAFFIFKTFPTSFLESTYQLMKFENTIVSTSKRQNAGKLNPGPDVTLSEKFLSSFTGSFPNRMIPLSLNYEAIFRKATGSFPMPLRLDSGYMLMLTEFLTAGKLKIENEILDSNSPTSFSNG
jgi:hypothetical protein